MTLKELSQLHYLQLEIQWDKQRLEELKMSQPKVTQTYSDMPKGKGGIKDTMAKNVAYIVDLEQMLKKNIKKQFDMERRILSFINSIDNCFLRLIFKLRFIDGKKWRAIAYQIGGGNSSLTVRNSCYRYLARFKNL